MTVSDNEAAVKAMQEVLGTPITAGLSDEASRVRRNLIAASMVAIIVELGGASVSKTTTVFGVPFEDLTTDMIHIGLLVGVAYLLIHFLFYVAESFLEWRLRITGTRVAYITGGVFGHEGADYPSDPRQSTFYNWWKGEAGRIGNLRKDVMSMKESHDLAIEQIKPYVDNYQTRDANNVMNLLAQSLQRINNIESALGKIQKTITSDRIPASLERFDNWFEIFLRLQNFRWLAIDVLFPVLLSACALYLLSV